MSIENEIIDFDEIDVYLLNGIKSNNPKELHVIYQTAFKCWYNEHEKNAKLNSNDFTRQDEVLAIFYKGECFATTFFKEVNWDDETAALDSHFNLWNEETIEELISRGKNILICSQFTISQNFRDKKTDISWESILSGFNMKRFLESETNAMTGELNDVVAFFQNEIKVAYRKTAWHPKLDKIWDRLNRKSKSQWRLVA